MKKKIHVCLGLLLMMSLIVASPLKTIAEIWAAAPATSERSLSEAQTADKDGNVSENDRLKVTVHPYAAEENPVSMFESLERQSRAPDDAREPVDYGEQFITRSVLQDKYGNIPDSFEQYETLMAHFEWVIPEDVAIYEGDMMTLSLPEQLVIMSDFSFNVLDAVGQIVGTAQTNKETGTIVVTFSDYFTSHLQNRFGIIDIYTHWNQDLIVVDEVFDIHWTAEAQTIFIKNGGPSSDELLFKFGWVDDNDPSLIQWRVRINLAEETIHNAVVKDTIGSNQTLVAESLAAYYGSFDLSLPGAPFTETGQVPDNVFTEISETGFVMNFGTLNQAVFVSYYTRASDDTVLSQYENTAELTGENIETEVINEFTPETGANGSGSGDEVTSVTVTKQWDDADNQDGLRADQVRVQLFLEETAVGEPVVLHEANDWHYTWTGLTKSSEYKVAEIDELPGYSTTITSDGQGKMTITNKHAPETINISGQKTWDDNNNQDGKRPAAVTVRLLADGVPVASRQVSAADGWAYEWTDLPKYDSGEAISYTVTEDSVPDYSTAISGYDITNSYTPGKTSLTVVKQWQDNHDQDGKRPDFVTAQLLADGQPLDTAVQLNADNNWSYTWSDLDEKARGRLIDYTVKEMTLADGYSASVQNDGSGTIVLVNTYTKSETVQTKATNSDKTTGKQQQLPRTDAVHETALIIAGYVILIVGLALFYRRHARG